MRAKRVLFFTCEAGGAEVLAPVIALLKARRFRVRVLAYGHGYARLRRRGIACSMTGHFALGDLRALDRFEPDIVITSATSLPQADMSEKYLWVNARRRGIPTLAFVDQWQNYALRFSGPGKDEALAYQPDLINCINSIGRQEMLAAGFDRRRLAVLGQPYLSSVSKDFARLDAGTIRRKLGIAADAKVALFVSEPIHENFGRARGYDQYTVLAGFLSHFSRRRDPPALVVKLHPKDETRRFRRLAAGFKALRPILVHNEITSVEAIKMADAVYGMSSIMLIESFILGRDTFCLQPGLKGTDPFVLSRHGILRRGFAPRRGRRRRFDFEFKAARFLKALSILRPS